MRRVCVWTMKELFGAVGGEFGERHGEGYRLIAESWRNALEIKKSDESKINEIVGLIMVFRSCSSLSFLSGVFDSDLSAKMPFRDPSCSTCRG